MGRLGSQLLTFLRSAIEKQKYQNLKVDSSGLTFSITLPRKTKKLSVDDELIFKDWYELKNKDYVFGSRHYTMAKQTLITSLKKSDYVEKVSNSRNKLTYRILEECEVKEKKRLKKELKQNVNIENPCTVDTLSSTQSENTSAGDSPPSGKFVETKNGNLIALDGTELSQVNNCLETNENELNEIFSPADSGYGSAINSPQSENSTVKNNNLFFLVDTKSSQVLICLEANKNVGMNVTLLPLVEFANGKGVDSLPISNSVEPSNENLSISSDDVLSQVCHLRQENSLLQNKGIQQTAYSTPCVLDEFVISEGMDIRDSTEVQCLDATASSKVLLERNQPRNYLLGNPEHATPCLNLMEWSSQNTNLENYRDENEPKKMWDLIQTMDITDKEIDNFIIKNIPALNSNHSMANEENLNTHVPEMQNMHGQRTECEDHLTKELRNNFTSDINFYPSTPVKVNLSKQIYSSQGMMRTDFQEAISMSNGSQTVKEYNFTNNHLASSEPIFAYVDGLNKIY